MINTIKTLAKQEPVNPEKLKPLKESAENWRIEVGALKQQLNTQTGTQQLPPQSPVRAKSQDKSMGGQLIDNYRMAVEGQSSIMEVAQKAMFRSFLFCCLEPPYFALSNLHFY